VAVVVTAAVAAVAVVAGPESVHYRCHYPASASAREQVKEPMMARKW
jgi:hypothetical protein